jgi:pyruvate dehydrogenase (quinone)
MLLGDLLTTLQHELPIKIVVYDNGKLGFVDIEQKAAGLVPVYTDPKNPDFGEVATAMGLWGRSLSKAGELEDAIKTWLAQPDPALLHAKVNPMQPVTPPSSLVAPEAVVGMAVYTARATLHGKGHDVSEMLVENIPGAGKAGISNNRVPGPPPPPPPNRVRCGWSRAPLDRPPA